MSLEPTLFNLFNVKVPLIAGMSDVTEGVKTETMKSIADYKGSVFISKFTASTGDNDILLEIAKAMLVAAYVNMYGLSESQAIKVTDTVFEKITDNVSSDTMGMTYLQGGDQKHWVLLAYVEEDDNRVIWLGTGAMGLEFDEVIALAKTYAEALSLEYTSRSLGRVLH